MMIVLFTFRGFTQILDQKNKFSWSLGSDVSSQGDVSSQDLRKDITFEHYFSPSGGCHRVLKLWMWPLVIKRLNLKP
jgi:hypothetical protein